MPLQLKDFQGLWDCRYADVLWAPEWRPDHDLVEWWIETEPINNFADPAAVIQQHRVNRAKYLKKTKGKGKGDGQAPVETTPGGDGKRRGKGKSGARNQQPLKAEPVKQPALPKHEPLRPKEVVESRLAVAPQSGQSKAKQQAVKPREESSKPGVDLIQHKLPAKMDQRVHNEAAPRPVVRAKAVLAAETQLVASTTKQPARAKGRQAKAKAKATVETFALPKPDLQPRQARTREELIDFQRADTQEVMLGRVGHDQMPAFQKRWVLEEEMFEQHEAQRANEPQAVETVAKSAIVPEESKQHSVAVEAKPVPRTVKSQAEMVPRRTDPEPSVTRMVLEKERDAQIVKIMSSNMASDKKSEFLAAMTAGWQQEDAELDLASEPASTPEEFPSPTLPPAQTKLVVAKATEVSSGLHASRWVDQPDQTKTPASALEDAITTEDLPSATLPPAQTSPIEAKPTQASLGLQVSRRAEQPRGTDLVGLPAASKPTKPASGLASKWEGKVDRLRIVDFKPSIQAVQGTNSESEPGPSSKQVFEAAEPIQQSGTSGQDHCQETTAPAKKAGPITKLKSVIKSKVADIRRLSLPGESPRSAHPSKTVSCEDVSSPTVIPAKASGDPDEWSPLVDVSEFRAPAETSPSWPSPQHFEESSTIEAYASAPSLLQDVVGLKKRNKDLKQRLQDVFEITDRLLEENKDVAKLREEVVEQNTQRAMLQYNEDNWKEDKEQVLKELKLLREQGGRIDGETAALVEQLKEQIQQQDEHVKELREDRDAQKSFAQCFDEERKQAERRYNDLVAERGSAAGEQEFDEDRKQREQVQQELVDYLRDQVDKKEVEATELRVKLLGMKKLVVDASTRRQQVDDATIDRLASEVYYGLIQFVTNDLAALVRRSSAQFDLGGLPKHTRSWTDTYLSLPSIHVPDRIRPYVFISIICKTLCEAFKAHYYFGAPASSPIQAAMGMAKALRPERDHKTRQWFDTVSKLIDKKDSNILPQAEQALLQHMVKSVKTDIGLTVPGPWMEETETRLATIFKRAIDLFHTLHQQDARYFVDMAPARQWTFSAAQMEDVFGSEEPAALKGREIEVSVFPAVYKRGGKRGEDEFLTTVVAKARVVTRAKSTA